MTEPASSPHDEQVRRLLADARHDAPIPPEVAARLDGVLGDLATERQAPLVPPPPLGPPAPPATPVIDLAARRRRRQGAALLVAAAAVVAIGVGVGTMVDRGGEDAGSAGGTGSDQTFDRAEPEAADGGGAAPSSAPREPDADGLMRMQPLVVSSDTFAADAERYRGAALAAQQKPSAQESDESAFACDLASFGPGVHVPVLYDGMEAVLAYRPPTDDAQVVDLLQCGTGDVVRTTTLPVP